jgi:hypothetical protein
VVQDGQQHIYGDINPEQRRPSEPEQRDEKAADT